MSIPSLSVIIPAKNEEESLRELIPALQTQLPDAEVIIVNDGSEDKTEAICQQFSVNVISHPYSKGNGAAIKAGARLARGKTLVFMDGDGQHQPEDIPELLKGIESGYDMVVGARDKNSQANGWRWCANSFYNWFASWMTEQKVVDLTSGFRAVNAKKFKEYLYLLPNGFSYPTTITMAFFRIGYSVGYRHVSVKKRNGKSHIRLFKDGFKFFLIIFKISILYSPLKLFSSVSGGLFLIGLSYYLYTYIMFSRFTNMGMLIMLSSILVFMIGLVSEQIATLFYKHK